MKRLLQIFLVVIAIIAMNACDPYCLEGNGKIKSEFRVVSEFYSVENNTSFNVKITYDTITTIRVDADENLLELIKTSVRNGNLVIENDNSHCVKSYSNALINIRVPELEVVELNGSGSADVYNFDCTNIEIRNSGSGDIDVRELSAHKVSSVLTGSGDIYLEGNTAEAYYSVSGSGDINAFDMTSEIATVNNSGSGDISCFVYNHLEVKLTGSGDVVYAGPSSLIVDKEESGSGDIYKRD